MTPNTKFDAVVVGAGIQGLSAGAHLARDGGLSVLVVERQTRVLLGSSSKTAGMLMLQRENETKISMSIYSYLTFLNFKQEFGVDVNFQRVGYMSLATPDCESRVIKYVDVRRQLGVRTELLTPNEASLIDPLFEPSSVSCAVYGPDDGTFNVEAIARGYIAAIENHGGSIRVSEHATGADIKLGRVASVTTTEDSYDCDWVINAAGSDAGHVGEWFGDTLPIESLRRTIFRYRPDCLFNPNGPLVEDAAEEFYYRGDGDAIIFGLGREAVESPDLTAEELGRQWDRAQTAASVRFPQLVSDNYLTHRSGFRQMTPDITPLVGRSSHVDGVVHSCGWGGEGVQHSPAGGRAVSDIVFERSPRYFNSDKLDPNRFS